MTLSTDLLRGNAVKGRKEAEEYVRKVLDPLIVSVVCSDLMLPSKREAQSRANDVACKPRSLEPWPEKPTCVLRKASGALECERNLRPLPIMRSLTIIGVEEKVEHELS